MDTPNRQERCNIENDLFENICKYDFFQAVRLLELLYPDKKPVGEWFSPENEVVRFKPRVSLDFPGSNLYELLPISENNEHNNTLIVTFMRLAGLQAPLPMVYAKWIMDREREGDTAFEDFINIFNHRIISLLYKTYKKHSFFFETKDFSISRCVAAISGLKNTDHDTELYNELLPYAEIFSQQNRSMTGLEMLLSNYFNIKVKGKQFCLKRYLIPEEYQSTIGFNGKYQVLGKNLRLGKTFISCKNNFELIITISSIRNYLQLLPIFKKFLILCQTIRLYVKSELDFDIIFQVSITNEDFNKIKKYEKIFGLGKIVKNKAKLGTRLGWTSFLTDKKKIKQEKYTYRIKIPQKIIRHLKEYK